MILKNSYFYLYPPSIITTQMDKGTIIISAVFLAACILPIIYFKISRKNKQQKMLQSLQSIALQSSATIHQHGFCLQTAVGLDTKNHQFFYFNSSPTSIVSRHSINLNEVKSVKVKKTYRPNSSSIDRLDLVFVFKDSHKKELSFNFFESEQTLQIGTEMLFLEEWENILNQELNSI